MPKKTMAQKLRNQMRNVETSRSTQVGVLQNEFTTVDSVFKKDMMKSIFFAVLITVFEIALYFIYYLRVFERR